MSPRKGRKLMVKKRATKSVKPAKKKIKSLPLSAKKAKGVRGGLYIRYGDISGDSTSAGHEKWIE
jgi:hypothetical protein